MKNTLLILSIILFLTTCSTTSNNGVKISGFVENSENEYIAFHYVPRLRGIFDFDGFTGTDTYIDSKGNFNLSSENITDGANYSLEFKNEVVFLVLFNGDNIQMNFDMNNLERSLKVTGKGAGKINVLYLKQFIFENSDLEKFDNIDSFSNHIDTIVSNQIALLNSIYNKKENDIIISEAANKIEIQKVITDTPLTEKEYNFLLNRINFKRYNLQTRFLSKLSKLAVLDSIEINFDSKAFKHFNIQEYQKLDEINDYNLTFGLESILQIEYLRELENIKITYSNWQSFFYNSDYEKWCDSFLHNNFNSNIYNKYYGDLAAYLMTLGGDYKLLYEKLDANNKYVKRINDFENLLENGVHNTDYIPKENVINLDKKKFESLLKSYKNKPLFIVFWSAQFAGSSIVNNLSLIKDFEEANKEKVSIINICIDKQEYKNLWAARIIDNLWKSNHYFLPMEGNDTILNKFSDKKISAFCDGGATYAFINGDGLINNSIKFPFHLSASELEEMIK